VSGLFIGILLVVFVVIFLYAGVPLIFNKLMKFVLMQKAIKSKSLVLTFDDGPGNRLTPLILDLLGQYKAKATFFLLGRNISGREDIVRRISNEGHEICSHGYEHLNYLRASPFRTVRDIKKGWEKINSVLSEKNGEYAFRPPYGRLNLVSLLYLLMNKVPIYYWTVVSGDTRPCDKRDSQVASKLLTEAGGAVVLAHDFDRSDNKIDSMVLECVESLLITAKKESFKLMTVSELLEN
jgi:peptidoglycan/xylan/chitin deacetylase (PgdA/CDA1 family)